MKSVGDKALGVGSPILPWMLSHGFAWLCSLCMETAAQASSGMGATAAHSGTEACLSFWDLPLPTCSVVLQPQQWEQWQPEAARWAAVCRWGCKCHISPMAAADALWHRLSWRTGSLMVACSWIAPGKALQASSRHEQPQWLQLCPHAAACCTATSACTYSVLQVP